MDAEEAARELSPFLSRAGGHVDVETDSPGEEVVARHGAHFAAAWVAARAAAIAADYVGMSSLVRACVEEGGRVLFRGNFSAEWQPTLSPLALLHLSSVAAALHECLRFWAKNATNVHGESTFLPSTLVWARSMLHLFQWALGAAGNGVQGPGEAEAPLPVHPPGGLAGHTEAWPLHAQAAGPAAVVPGLLLAQRIGAATGEVMVGCLPATVALARLLMAGKSPWDAPLQRRQTKRLLLPEVPPEIQPGGQPTADEAGGSVAVLRVELGSRASWALARRHLLAVIECASVSGRQVVAASVFGPDDVGRSESLWDAVQLWQHIGAQLALGCSSSSTEYSMTHVEDFSVEAENDIF